MNLKRIGMAAAVCAVVLGCVLAAGCTSGTSGSAFIQSDGTTVYTITENGETTQIVSSGDDAVLGTWEGGRISMEFADDGSGTRTIFAGTSQDTDAFIWTKSGEDTYLLSFMNPLLPGNLNQTVTLDGSQLVTEDGTFLSRADA